MKSPNRLVLEAVAERIEPLLEDVVFVGGQVAELLITDPGAVRVRPTDDVDIIISATSGPEYHRAENQLRDLGFINDRSEGAPICRWVSPDGHALDLMPTDEAVLGFRNRWYEYALEHALRIELSTRLMIRVPTAPTFVATKLDAFIDRGRGDLLASHDLEDFIVVVAGRPELMAEARKEAPALRTWLGSTIESLLDHPEFPYALEGALPDAVAVPGHREEIQLRLEVLSTLATDSNR